jgi:SAM-dependent methyltransferase
MLAAGATDLLLLEPEAHCLATLRDRFGAEPRVTISGETVPGSALLAANEGSLDLVVCQNVLEHVRDHHGAVAEMARALRPGGQLTIMVPAHPRLFGSLDHTYGHYRRYTREGLREAVEAAGLMVADLYSFNLLGVPGWIAKSRSRRGARIGAGSLAVYELLLHGWRPIERRWTPPVGLSLVVHARKP